MRSVRIEPKKVALVSALLFLILYSVVQLVLGAEAGHIFHSVVRSGFVMSFLGVMWWWYNKTGWKLKFWGAEKWLYEGPNLNGRWEGTVCRLKEDVPHKFVLEIVQTSLSLTFQTFSGNSSGNSLSATLVAEDEDGSSFKLHAIWETNSFKLDDSTARDRFYGASVWKISVPSATDRTLMQIADTYFTDREPPTKGNVRVKWISDDRLNRFE